MWVMRGGRFGAVGSCGGGRLVDVDADWGGVGFLRGLDGRGGADVDGDEGSAVGIDAGAGVDAGGA